MISTAVQETSKVGCGFMAEQHEVKTVEIAGLTIDAAKVICPECNTLWLDTDFETSEVPWVATCPKGHIFGVTP